MTPGPARARRPEDWQRDLAAARGSERWVADLLAADPRIEHLSDHTADYDRLDFSFWYAGQRVDLDVKEKINPTSRGLATLWPDVPPHDLFVLDEIVLRRIVWHGGGGYLAIHDRPRERWALFGPWELTLGPKVRYQRWGQAHGGRRFLKGKLLLDLRSAAAQSTDLVVDNLLAVVDRARVERDRVAAVAAEGLPEIGES